jgi:hypothetical protein
MSISDCIVSWILSNISKIENHITAFPEASLSGFIVGESE